MFSPLSRLARCGLARTVEASASAEPADDFSRRGFGEPGFEVGRLPCGGAGGSCQSRGAKCNQHAITCNQVQSACNHTCQSRGAAPSAISNQQSAISNQDEHLPEQRGLSGFARPQASDANDEQGDGPERQHQADDEASAEPLQDCEQSTRDLTRRGLSPGRGAVAHAHTRTRSQTAARASVPRVGAWDALERLCAWDAHPSRRSRCSALLLWCWAAGSSRPCPRPSGSVLASPLALA